jgi:choline kinase
LSETYARRLADTLDSFVAERRLDEPMEEAVRALLQASPAGAFGICDVTDLPWIEIDFAADVAKARDVILPALEKVGESR